MKVRSTISFEGPSRCYLGARVCSKRAHLMLEVLLQKHGQVVVSFVFWTGTKEVAQETSAQVEKIIMNQKGNWGWFFEVVMRGEKMKHRREFGLINILMKR